jgi:peptide/nickel transport system permease protein
MRGSAQSVLNADYLTVARAKGLTERRIVVRYLGKNAVLPLITTFAIALGSIFSGAMLIESLFSYPGIGYFLTEALNNRDYTLIQGLFLVTTLAMITFTLAADIVVAWLDPRIGD